MQEPYEDLIYAVILQACKDFRTATIRIRRYPNDLLAQRMRADVERFFLSDWFAFLCPYDGEWMLNVLKEKMK